MDPNAEVKTEQPEEENPLMIDDDFVALNDGDNNEDDDDEDLPMASISNEDNEDQVKLDKLPRPVNELNCRQARTFLVKLLRAANGGQNPSYGNSEMKPPFWPDYYWPWEQLTDVHTKPRGMNEPLQYSEMMKLAIGRGYQYFGYDPNTYVCPEGSAGAGFDDEDEDDPSMPEPIVNISEDPFIESEEFDSHKYYLKPPPRMPRPLSRINCVQSRTTLARLLRYQQAGNNPVYGSPDTEPPWWPNEMIRWVDMVDLRGKPPYLPDTKSYTDVLKQAIKNAMDYYGYDPELHLEDQPPMAGLIGEKQKMFPLIPAAGIAPPPPPRPYTQPTSLPPPKPPIILSVPKKLENLLPKNAADNADEADDFDEDMGEMPPRLPIPVGKMNCSVTRTCLARLIRFHCGRGQLPNYGNPNSMPVWWPNHLIDWSKIKNLSHRYVESALQV